MRASRSPMSRATLLFAFLMQACGSSSEDSNKAPVQEVPPEVQVVTRMIVPSDTSSKIKPTIGDHFIAIGPAAARKGRLLVFYPGSNARPDQYSTFLIRAAALGYHAIGLAYHNEYRINFDICINNPPPECHEPARLEILLGMESGYNPPDVDTDNAAFNRLIQLLRYLDAQHGDEGWGGYLDAAGAPKWDRIAFGGQSQGGGHAAMTAKLKRVDRVILFDATEPADWTKASFATPAERFFGFAHTKQPIYDPIQLSWQNLRITGALVPTSVDGAVAPFGGSHSLSTGTDNCRGDPTSGAFHHNCSVVDGWFPFAADGKTPLFQPVWDYTMSASLP